MSQRRNTRKIDTAANLRFIQNLVWSDGKNGIVEIVVLKIKKVVSKRGMLDTIILGSR